MPHSWLETSCNVVTKKTFYGAEYCKTDSTTSPNACREIKPPVHQAGWKTFSGLGEEQFFHQLDCIPWYGTVTALLLTGSSLLATTQHTLPHMEWYKYWQKIVCQAFLLKECPATVTFTGPQLNGTVLYLEPSRTCTASCYRPASIT